MYVRVTGGRLYLTDDNGRPAAGYYVYTYLAGTTTAAVSYLNKDCAAGHENTNPIVLNSRGECRFYTNRALKMVFTTPGGSPSSPIWEEDYLGEQQGVPPLTVAVTPGTVDNKYVGTVSPALTSVSDAQMFIIRPDVDSLDTLQSTVFTGTGINDLTWSGPYVGSTPGSVFQTQVVSVVVQPPTAPTLAAGAAGLVTNGNHYVLVTFVTAEGETTAGVASAVINISSNDKIELSNIPVGVTGKGVTDRNIYMTTAGGSTYYLVGSVGDNTTTTYEINMADSSLPSTEPPSSNGTGDGAGADVVKWRKDGGSWNTISITGSFQAFIEGVGATFAELTGHVIGDVWSLTVMTPASLNIDGTGDWILYRVIGGELKALDGGDLKAGNDSVLVANATLSYYTLINPSLPVLESQVPTRVRKEIYTDYTILESDWGNEISCNTDLTITFPALSTIPNNFFYIHPGPYTVTIQTDPGTPTDTIVPPYSSTGVTSYDLYIGGPGTVQLGNNGVSLHILAQVAPVRDYIKRTIYATAGTFTWTKTAGYNWAKVTVVGAGGGGGASDAGGNPGSGGGTGGIAEKTIDISAITLETVTVGAKGVGQANNHGTNGGSSSFGSHCSAGGGAYGLQGVGSGPVLGGVGGFGATGDLNIRGEAGGQSAAGAATSGRGGSGPYGGGGSEVLSGGGNIGQGNGAGGSGGIGGSGLVGGDGSPGLVIVEEYR